LLREIWYDFTTSIKYSPVMKNIPLYVLCVIYLIVPMYGAEPKSPLTTIKFNQISTLKLDTLKTDVQFSISDINEVSIQGESMVLSSLGFNVVEGALSIDKGKYSSITPIKLNINLPSKCLLDIAVVENSHVFIPTMNAPVRLNAQDRSQVTLEGCVGLIVTASDDSKVKVNQCSGDVSVTLADRCEFGIKQGTLTKALITATELSRVSIMGSIQSLNLTTRGAAVIKLGAVTEAFVWTGRGNEHLSLQRLSGIADITSNYNSVLTVESANLKTLLAATAANGKIKIGGVVENVALSTRGGSEIVIDKVTGKILRKNEMRKGSIKILNP
jgi:hypothetical protein